MRARDQCSIFSTGRKFRPDYGLLLELHALSLVARSYALLIIHTVHMQVLYNTHKSRGLPGETKAYYCKGKADAAQW